MKKWIVLIAFIVLSACSSAESTYIPKSTDVPKGESTIVTNADDNGPGTLRQALLDANPGDTIEFDTSVFPIDQPNVIYVQSQLPFHQGNLTLDASQAGVILDGSEFSDGSYSVIQIHLSNITIRGFQLRNFPGNAIYIDTGQNNLIIDNVIGACAYGITLGGPETSDNIVTGNYIGVLADGITPFPNRNTGISVGEGAYDNQIGPDNVIAFNDQFGIIVQDPNSIGNTIVQNSIHDNGWGGISLIDSNNNLSAPTIIDFDLGTGTLSGTACANCIVELFSDNGHQGETIEGQAKADDNGEFVFEKNTSFTGPFLTATATDSDGNSSAFSQRTFGLMSSSTLQDGNSLNKTEIVLKPYQELLDNRIGHLNPIRVQGESTCPLVEENGRFQEFLEWGSKWMSTGIDERELYMPRGDGWHSRSEVTEYQDCTVNLLIENGVTIVNTLNYWDENLHAEKWPDYGDEEDIQRFLEHNRLLVRHFKGRIQYYEILSEQHAYVEVEDYINFLRQVIPVIHEEDPEAKIVVGGVTGVTGPDMRGYLFEILRSDIMPLVDAIAIHPMYGTSPQYDEREYYYYYPTFIQEIKDIATAHGFSGVYMASEMQWGTPSIPTPDVPWLYTYTVAAKYYARGIVMNLGMDVWAGFGGVQSERETVATNPFIIRTIRNLSEVMAGTEAIEFPIEIINEYTNIKSYSFSLPNDEELIVLWSDGVAVDHDPGIPSTLIIPDHAGQKATGIDVLFGFEQELITSNENGDLVISGFLLLDYPIFIRLSNSD